MASRRGDPLRERTARLLADFLQFCAREPGAPAPPPPTREAALLREAALRLRRRHAAFFAPFRGGPGGRVALLERAAEALLAGRRLSWGRVVTLLAVAGTLLEPAAPGAAGGRRSDEVARDCGRLANLLCALLADRHRAWLEAQGGWDGFCLFLGTPLPLSFWTSLLLQAVASCVLATAVLYFWTRRCPKS